MAILFGTSLGENMVDVKAYSYPASKKCVLCGKKFFGYGNNPAPLSKKGECCESCNISRVIPARLNQFYERR
jgi:hypothetical protein